MNALALIIGCAGTAFFGWLLYDGFRSGTMQLNYVAMRLHGRRKDQPIRFWLTGCAIFAWFLAALVVVALTLAGME